MLSTYSLPSWNVPHSPAQLTIELESGCLSTKYAMLWAKDAFEMSRARYVAGLLADSNAASRCSTFRVSLQTGELRLAKRPPQALHLTDTTGTYPAPRSMIVVPALRRATISAPCWRNNSISSCVW